ncbi:hypothetical protein PR048_023313 [Dryococelus australis]|uniref:Uncharacterized protein n=1 Tax=Dryococelus australis TaxID=614101 RepID=A0ABQ9GTU3_9NEOP|nr:hypothetical protein PR048_023313 [Dryococelus australis]
MDYTPKIQGPQWLSGWPTGLPPRRTGFNPRPGHRIFPCGNRVGRCRWSGFLVDLPFPPPLHSGATPYSPQSPTSALNTSLLRAAQISTLTHSKGTCQQHWRLAGLSPAADRWVTSYRAAGLYAWSCYTRDIFDSVLLAYSAPATWQDVILCSADVQTHLFRIRTNSVIWPRSDVTPRLLMSVRSRCSSPWLNGGYWFLLMRAPRAYWRPASKLGVGVSLIGEEAGFTEKTGRIPSKGTNKSEWPEERRGRKCRALSYSSEYGHSAGKWRACRPSGRVNAFISNGSYELYNSHSSILADRREAKTADGRNLGASTTSSKNPVQMAVLPSAMYGVERKLNSRLQAVLGRSEVPRTERSMSQTPRIDYMVGVGEIWATRNIEVLRADESDVRGVWSIPGGQGWPEIGDPGENPPASSSMITTRKNPGATPTGIEPGSPRESLSATFTTSRVNRRKQPRAKGKGVRDRHTCLRRSPPAGRSVAGAARLLPTQASAPPVPGTLRFRPFPLTPCCVTCLHSTSDGSINNSSEHPGTTRPTQLLVTLRLVETTRRRALHLCLSLYHLSSFYFFLSLPSEVVQWRTCVREAPLWNYPESTLASHQGEPGSIPGRVTGFSQVGIVPDDAVGRRVFPEDLPFPPPLHSGAAPYSLQSPSSDLKTSMSRAAHISSLQLRQRYDAPLASVLEDVCVEELSSSAGGRNARCTAWRLGVGMGQNKSRVVELEEECESEEAGPVSLRGTCFASGGERTPRLDPEWGRRTRQQNGVADQRNVGAPFANQRLVTYSIAGSPSQYRLFTLRVFPGLMRQQARLDSPLYSREANVLLLVAAIKRGLLTGLFKAHSHYCFLLLVVKRGRRIARARYDSGSDADTVRPGEIKGRGGCVTGRRETTPRHVSKAFPHPSQAGAHVLMWECSPCHSPCQSLSFLSGSVWSVGSLADMSPTKRVRAVDTRTLPQTA